MSGPAPPPIRVLHLVKGLEAGGAEELLVQAARHRDRTAFSYEVAYLLGTHVAREPDLVAEQVAVTCLHGERTGDLRWLGRLRRLVTGTSSATRSRSRATWVPSRNATS